MVAAVMVVRVLSAYSTFGSRLKDKSSEEIEAEGIP